MRLRAATLVAILLASGPARAQDEEDARAIARKHFRAGEAHQQAARYDDAIDEYLHAYALAPLPGLLFNLGQAYRLKGDRKKALDSYRKYLATQPTGRGAAEAKGHIEALEASLKSSPEPEPPPPPPVAPAPVPPAALPVDAEEPPAGGGRGLRIAGLVTGSLGIVGIGAGVYFGLHARRICDDLETLYDPSDVDRGEAADRNMKIAYAAGGAALATGITLFVLGTTRRPARIAVAPGGLTSVIVFGEL